MEKNVLCKIRKKYKNKTDHKKTTLIINHIKGIKFVEGATCVCCFLSFNVKIYDKQQN